jgi:hypothetical protein
MSLIYTSGDTGRTGRLADRKAVSADWTSDKRFIEKLVGISFQLISDFQADAVVVLNTDSAASSGEHLTLGNVTFTGKEGATVRIEGSASNDGDHVLTSVVSAHVGAFAGSTFTDETFTGAETITVLRTDSPLVGTWSLEVSNDFSTGIDGNDRADTGRWSDWTDTFYPAIDGVTGSVPLETDNTEQTNQPIQASPVEFRAFRVRFDYTSGLGNISVLYFGKGR